MENQEKTRQQTPSTTQANHTPTDTSTAYDQELQNEPTSQQGTRPSFDLAEAEKLLEQKLGERDAAATEQQNLSYVKSEATKALGSEYPYLFSQKSKELGLDQDHLNEMAKTQPQAFLAIMLGQDYKRPDSAAPPVGSVNTTAQQALSDTHSNKNSIHDWDEIRRTDPKKYWSPEVQNEIFKAAFEAQDRDEEFA